MSAIFEVNPLTAAGEVAKDFSIKHPTIIWHLKQIGKVKKFNKFVPHELIANKKNHYFEVSSSFILCSNEPFLNLIVSCDDISIVMCDKKRILYDNRQQAAQWLDWEEAPKHLLDLNLNQKEIMVTVWWSAVHLFHYSFLNPSKTVTSKKYAQQID